MRIAIHSVFIAKENILFLEEWIKYHQLIGVTDFYLYDNSKVNKIVGWDERNKDKIILGKRNKYNIDYDKLVKMNKEQVAEHLKKLCDKYKCVNIIEWSPRDEEGNILYKQKEGHMHCLERLKKDKIDWCAIIDMDEFIVLKNNNNLQDYVLSLSDNIKAIQLHQKRFETRFKNLDKLIIDIKKCIDKNFCKESVKHFFNVENTEHITVHSIRINNEYKVHTDESKNIWFNHYKIKESNDFIDEDNIPIEIREKINICNFVPLKSYIN